MGEENVARKLLIEEVEGFKRRGRPKKIWLDYVRENIDS